MKTSEYLKKVQLHFMQPDQEGAKEYFLCLVAEHSAELDVSIMKRVLADHGLYHNGWWNAEMRMLERNHKVPYVYIRELRIFVRGLFLHLAIQHYESKGD